MSSSRGHRSSRSSSKSSGWSGWEWDGDHGRYKRSRYTSRGELIWDWEKPPDEDAEAATQPPADLDPIQEDVDPTSEITDSLQNTTLDTVQGAGYGTQYNTQYSTQYGTPKYGTQYGAQVGKGKATATASTVTFSTSPTDDARTNRRSRTQAARKNRGLDSNYKIHKSKDFRFGRIFRVFWSEPKGGNGGTEITDNGDGFSKVRPFMVIDNKRGHCLCLPILTYGGQGTLKPGAHPDDHTVIYSSSSGPSVFLNEQITRKSIKVDVTSPANKLDPASRLNYAKVYTVEHNVKVYFIGQVDKRYEQKVVDDYKAVNPPLPDRPYIESSDENTARYAAEGYDPSYPAEGENEQYPEEYEEDQHENQEVPPDHQEHPQDYQEDPQDYQQDQQHYEEGPQDYSQDYPQDYHPEPDEEYPEGSNYTTEPGPSETPPYREHPRTLPPTHEEEESALPPPELNPETGEGSNTQRYQRQYPELEYQASEGGSGQRHKHKRSGRR